MNTKTPPCPSCTLPVTGPHRVADDGSVWHIGCWEREHGMPSDGESDGLDFWAEKE
jgi:hypothetical protein